MAVVSPRRGDGAAHSELGDGDRFYVTLDSKTYAGLDDVLAAVRGAGLTLAKFTGLNYSNDYRIPIADTYIEWHFSLTLPLTQMKPPIGLFTAVQTSLRKVRNTCCHERGRHSGDLEPYYVGDWLGWGGWGGCWGLVWSVPLSRLRGHR